MNVAGGNHLYSDRIEIYSKMKYNAKKRRWRNGDLTKAQAQVLLRLSMVAGAVVGLFFFLRWLAPLLTPFIIAWLIALIINPVVNLLEKRLKVPRMLAVMLTLSLFVVLLLSVLTLLTAKIIIELTQLLNILPHYLNQVQIYISHFLTQEVLLNLFNQLETMVANLDPVYQDRINESIRTGIDYITDAATQLFVFLLNSMLGFFTSLPSTALLLIISFAAALFISKDWYRLKKALMNMMPPRLAESSYRIWGYLRKATFGFIWAQLILISVTGAIVIGYLMVLGVQYAMTIGLVMALFDLLPYLGVGTILIPWAAYCLIVGDLRLGIALAFLYLLIAVARQLLEPKIVGDQVGLDPLLTLVALYVGVQLFGVAGALIGPVALVILVSFHRANVFHDLWSYITQPLRSPADPPDTQ